MKHQRSITIIGAGIAGLTVAIALKQIGIEATLFEASGKDKTTGAGLGLGVNAILALQALGLDKEIISQGYPLSVFSIFDQKGKQISKSVFKEVGGVGHAAIHRASLQQILLSKIEANSIHFNKRIIEMEDASFGWRLHFADGTNHFTNYIIAADGIRSIIRQKLQPTSTPVYAGYTCWRAVVESQVPFSIKPTETWGQNGRFGIVPLGNNKTYWFACVNANAEGAKHASFSLSELQELFSDYHQPIPAILARTRSNQLIHNHIYDLKPLRQFAYGRIVLVGDAAHATTPNMAQGACMAIEDAVELATCLHLEADYETAFLHFEKRRLARTQWVIETSRQIGRMAQLENLWLIRIRNSLLRILPDSMADKNLKKLAAVSFTDLKSIHQSPTK